MSALGQDLRYALSALRRDPGFTTITILTLALGLPVPEPDRVTMVWTHVESEGLREGTSAYANIRDWDTRNRVFDELATFDPTTLTLTDGEWPESVPAVLASANLFEVLGVEPSIGRAFTPEEQELRLPVAVLGRQLWMRRFGGSASAIGRSVELGGTPFEVVGVMPDGLPAAATDPMTSLRHR